jgi:hypothetical protein
MRHQVALALLLFHSAIGIRQSAFSEVPQLINYQGRLLNGTNLVNGNIGLSLRLFNGASGGTKIYEDSNTVTVADGLYSTFIGDHPTNAALLVALTNAAVWVEVAVNGSTLSPRERLASVGYALATRGVLVTTNGIVLHNPGTNTAAAGSAYAAIAGGFGNDIGIESDYSVIGGGWENSVAANSFYASIAGGGLNHIGTNSDYATIGGGGQNSAGAENPYSTIVGGFLNVIGDSSGGAAVGGGQGNQVADHSPYATIAGGLLNEIGTNSGSSAIGGGQGNQVAANSTNATIAGGRMNGVGTNADFSAIGGGRENTVAADGLYATIGGGYLNDIGPASYVATIGGGENNNVADFGQYATIAGGYLNDIGPLSGFSAIGGGQDNNVAKSSSHATIAGGSGNDIGTNAPYAAIGGGFDNNVSSNSPYAALLGGRENAVGAGATNALAAGRRAKANHRGAFVWGDDTNADVASTTNNEVTFRATGGVRMDLGDSPGILLNAANRALITRGWDPFTSGVHQAAGRWGLFMETSRLVLGIPLAANREFHIGRYNSDSTYTSLVRVTQSGDLFTLGTVNPPSDRNLKQDLTRVDGPGVLDQLVAMPVYTWAYKHDAATRHIGPTAQDFAAAFGFGSQDTSISTVDADGVALAAIQALAADGREQRSGFRVQQEQITSLEAENAALKQQLDDVLHRLRALEEK